MSAPLSTGAGLPIAAVERDTGLSKDTLRVWERRYGFPQPVRDANGERVYPHDQIDKLRLLKRLMDQGHRPGKIAATSFEQLQALAGAGSRKKGEKGTPVPGGSSDADSHVLDEFLHLITAHRVEDLRRDLARLTVKVGLARFVIDVVAPLTSLVGDRWARGDLAIFEEHMYTESVQAVLRNAIAAMPHPGDSPRVLLTTVPQEPHGLGVLMADAMFALEDACIVQSERQGAGQVENLRRAEGVLGTAILVIHPHPRVLGPLQQQGDPLAFPGVGNGHLALIPGRAFPVPDPREAVDSPFRSSNWWIARGGRLK